MKEELLGCVAPIMAVLTVLLFIAGICLLMHYSENVKHRREIELMEAKHKYQQIQIDTTNKER